MSGPDAAATANLAPALRLWQLISPSLPVGAYAYSNALEHVVAAGGVHDEAQAAAWLDDLLLESIARTDLPILLRVRRAAGAGDTDAVVAWCDRLVAMRETAELRFADRAMGEALARLLCDLGVSLPACDWPFAGAFAYAAARFAVSAEDAAAGYAWSWCESQVAAAIKLVPLGHTAGQRLMLGRGEAIQAAVARAYDIGDDEIGFNMPGLAIASARHETQYTRLFRS